MMLPSSTARHYLTYDLTSHQDYYKLRVNITVEGSTHCSPERSQFIQRALNDCKILKPVYLALKHIVYYCEMNESQTRGLSSYGLFLMVLSYIQNQSTTW